MRIHRGLLTLAGVAGVAFAAGHFYTGNPATAFGGDHAEKSGASFEEQMAACAVYGEPSEHHRYLDPLIGDFEAEFTMYAEPGGPAITSTGTISRKWILDGRFVKETVKATSEYGDFEGLGFIGYNNYDGQYEVAWMESHSTALMTETGFYDAAKKVLTFHGSHRDPLTGRVVNGWGEVDLTDPAKQVYVSYTIGPDGQRVKQFEGVARRKS